MSCRSEDNFDEVERHMERHLRETDRALENGLDAVGYEALNFARSETSVMKDPVKKGEGKRAAHPGGWADVSTVLVGEYDHDVELLAPSVWALELKNGAEYAHYLERRGYWVLSGLFEGKVQELVGQYIEPALR